MREKVRDKERLEHILNAIAILQNNTNGGKDVPTDEKSLPYFGIVKLIEVIGEAVYKLTFEFREEHPQTPWAQMERMRHVLVHGYYQVDPEFVVSVVRDDLTQLKQQIESYLSEF